ncbi:hypothetical protein IEQ34_022143 [Dendrobium chrysotoxum]|uniref:Uncharacterized protein n=1 Tax=Dendrobium chrysotoxum TaxID=161865 RepID=A0AAV7FY39_DENCH|nr:hypothetical protein IEQ34_022143 [Dendrobium chrysotoxum]
MSAFPSPAVPAPALPDSYPHLFPLPLLEEERELGVSSSKHYSVGMRFSVVPISAVLHGFSLPSIACSP